MHEKIMKEKIEVTRDRAEKAFQEILAEGGKVSQYSVERRAGLSNGTLNYDVDVYRELKTRIKTAKKITGSAGTGVRVIDTDSLQKEIRLKNKYREERDKLKQQVALLMGRNVELAHNLMLLQRYIKHLEEKGVAHSNVVKFKPSSEN